jgi:hypothetical protein
MSLVKSGQLDPKELRKISKLIEDREHGNEENQHADD